MITQPGGSGYTVVWNTHQVLGKHLGVPITRDLEAGQNFVDLANLIICKLDL